MALTNEDLLAISQLLDQKLEPINTRLDKLDIRLDKLDTRMEAIDTRMEAIESDVKEIKVTIENEVTTGIQIIAEGHLDLNRKLNEAIHISSDVKAKLEVHDLLLKKHESRLQLKHIV